MQSKRLTTIEVLTNTFTGLIGSWLISVWYISGDHGTYETATMITLLCTVWSILRGYVIRRIFNRISQRLVHKESDPVVLYQGELLEKLKGGK